jgi:hypothetical protein
MIAERCTEQAYARDGRTSAIELHAGLRAVSRRSCNVPHLEIERIVVIQLVVDSQSAASENSSPDAAMLDCDYGESGKKRCRFSAMSRSKAGAS